MKSSLLLIFNITFMLGTISYAHENFEQHAIVHVYPLLESEYINDENAKCKMGLLERSNCNSSEDENKNKSSK